MNLLDRRRLLVLGSAMAVSPALAGPISAFGIDGAQFGLRAGSAEDQSRAMQRAIEETARNRAPLAIAPGSYRVGNLNLPANAHIVGVRGATKLLFSDGPSLLMAAGAENLTLSGLVLDGVHRRLPNGAALFNSTTSAGSSLRIARLSMPAAPPLLAPRWTVKSSTPVCPTVPTLPSIRLMRARS